MSQVSCRGCRQWFDGGLAVCPECKWERPGYNKWLYTAMLNNNLYSQVEGVQPKVQMQNTYKQFKKVLRDS